MMNDTDRIRELIDRHAGVGITETAIPGVCVMRSETPTEPLGYVLHPALAFVFGGAKHALLGDAVFRYGAGQYLTIGAELPITAHITSASAEEPFLGLGIDLQPELIAALLIEASTPRLASEPTPLGVAVSDADEQLLNALARMLALLDSPGDIAGLAPLYQREVLWRALTGPQAELVRQVGLSDGRFALVARAIRVLRDNYSRSVSIDELAHVSAMSPATLHRHFRAVTNMTPIQYQKQLRLQEARKLLLLDPDDVAGAGFAVGYQSASQFSREYRRMFGAPPGRDAQMLRQAKPAALVTI